MEHCDLPMIPMHQVVAAYDWARVPHRLRAFSERSDCQDHPLYSMIHMLKYGMHLMYVKWQTYSPAQIFWAWQTAKGYWFLEEEAMKPLSAYETIHVPYTLPTGATWEMVIQKSSQFQPLECDRPVKVNFGSWIHSSMPWLASSPVFRGANRRDLLLVEEEDGHVKVLALDNTMPIRERLMRDLRKRALKYMETHFDLNMDYPFQQSRLRSHLTRWLTELASDGVSTVSLRWEKMLTNGDDLEFDVMHIHATHRTALSRVPRVEKVLAPFNMMGIDHIYILRFAAGKTFLSNDLRTTHTYFQNHLQAGVRFQTPSRLPLSIPSSGSMCSVDFYVEMFCGRIVATNYAPPGLPTKQQAPPTPPTRQVSDMSIQTDFVPGSAIDGVSLWLQRRKLVRDIQHILQKRNRLGTSSPPERDDEQEEVEGEDGPGVPTLASPSPSLLEEEEEMVISTPSPLAGTEAPTEKESEGEIVSISSPVEDDAPTEVEEPDSSSSQTAEEEEEDVIVPSILLCNEVLSPADLGDFSPSQKEEEVVIEEPVLSESPEEESDEPDNSDDSDFDSSSHSESESGSDASGYDECDNINTLILSASEGEDEEEEEEIAKPKPKAKGMPKSVPKAKAESAAPMPSQPKTKTKPRTKTIPQRRIVQVTKPVQSAASAPSKVASPSIPRKCVPLGYRPPSPPPPGKRAGEEEPKPESEPEPRRTRRRITPVVREGFVRYY